MNNTTRGERLHIGIFGRRNAGKSSLINGLTKQDIALVSDVAGTTTDPVYKSMEILPIGPVVLIDTAGIDDEGNLGEKRVKKSLEVLAKCDFCLIVTDAASESDDTSFEEELATSIKAKNIPALLVFNKIDLTKPDEEVIDNFKKKTGLPVCLVSAVQSRGIKTLISLIISESKPATRETILGDLIKPGDAIILVTPIDDAAPKGRLILPQVQTIRDILDNDALVLVVKERELAHAFRLLKEKVSLVVTDSQAFQKVAADTPEDVPLTSFSILFARYKGDLEAYMHGIKRISELKDGDSILIAEACTHHVQSDDIGTVKIPRWLRESTGLNLNFEKFSGSSYPEDLDRFKLVIHCGACMLNRREVLNRIAMAGATDIPITNYGMVIAYTFGILERALKPFPIAEAIFSGDIY